MGAREKCWSERKKKNIFRSPSLSEILKQATKNVTSVVGHFYFGCLAVRDRAKQCAGEKNPM